MKSINILVIDDEESMCDSCSQVYLKEGYLVDTALDGVNGLQKVRELKPDLVLVDLKMPGISGMEVLEEIRKIDPDIVSIVITGYSTIESAVEAMKKGAYDFLPKPFTPNELRLITKRALERRRLIIETNCLREEKERMKEMFISMVSHQLKSPLVAVQQYFEVILLGIAGEVTEEQRRMLERSKIRIDELIKLIKDWLNFAKIDVNKIADELKPINLAPIIAKVLDLMKTSASQKSITLKMDIPKTLPMVICNEEALEQVFLNLIENGIKYNKEKGCVIVKAKTENGYVAVEVCDTGIGIPEKEIPFICEQFYQIKKNKKTDGTGLGLSIVKRIVKTHSGSIKIKSEIGKGTTFTILLPKEKESKKC